MNIKKSVSSLIALVLALAIISGVEYAAASFTGPAASFPTCDSAVPGCNTPINVGTTSQVKNGDLAVNAFMAWKNAEFKQKVTVDGLANSVDHTVCVDQSGTLVLCNIPGAVRISSSVGQSLAVSGIAGYTQSPSPTGLNTTVSGTHTAFTGPIHVQVSGSAIAPNSQVVLTKNMTFVGCKTLTGPTTFDFVSTTYALNDSINISSVTPGSYSTCN